EDQDFGREQFTGDPADRYDFRTSPLRNVAVQPAFFHDGAFTRLEDAIQHHLDVRRSLFSYDPKAAGVDLDLQVRVGPAAPLVPRIDAELAVPLQLSPDEFKDLVEFVRDGLLDPRALPLNTCRLIPANVPSGRALLQFEGCPAPSN